MAMTPDSGDQDRDPRLEALYRASAESQRPPAHLDDAIRAAARKAVQAGPRRSPDRLRRWSVPLSLAAVIVLSVTVVTMMQEEGADRLTADDIAQSRAPLPAAKVELPERVAEAPAPAAPAVSEYKAPPPAPAAPAKQIAGQTAAAKPAEAEAAAARKRLPQEAVSREAALAKTAPEHSAAALAGSSARDALEEQAPPVAAAPRPLRRSAPAPAMADAGRDEAPIMARQSAKLGAASVKSADMLWQDLEREPADKWLDRLRELRRAGRVEDFERLATEFRRRFPEAVLPDDLR